MKKLLATFAIIVLACLWLTQPPTDTAMLIGLILVSIVILIVFGSLYLDKKEKL